jgi:serine/threonine protein kinase
VWLVWRDEGEATLWDCMRGRDFPFNLEPLLLERPLRLKQDKRRRLVTLKLVLAQVLEALESAHATGIGERGGAGGMVAAAWRRGGGGGRRGGAVCVGRARSGAGGGAGGACCGAAATRRQCLHVEEAPRHLLRRSRQHAAPHACTHRDAVHRDVKPQNIILSVADKRAKLIDLGAAADLRLGINYVPNEYLLDPRCGSVLARGGRGGGAAAARCGVVWARSWCGVGAVVVWCGRGRGVVWARSWCGVGAVVVCLAQPHRTAPHRTRPTPRAHAHCHRPRPQLRAAAAVCDVAPDGHAAAQARRRAAEPRAVADGAPRQV